MDNIENKVIELGECLASSYMEHKEEEYLSFANFIYNKSIRAAIIGIVGLVLLSINFILNGTYDYLFLICFIPFVLFISILVRNLKEKKKFINILKERKNYKTKVDFYNEYIEINSEYDSSSIHQMVKYSDIVMVLQNDKYVYLRLKTLHTILDKTKCSGVDDIYDFITSKKEVMNNKKAKINDKTNKLLSTFVVLSILSIVLTMVVIAIIGTFSKDIDNFDPSRYLWLFFLIMPIPLTSLILGIIYRFKGYKCIANIIVGIITIIVCFMYGSLFFMVK